MMPSKPHPYASTATNNQSSISPPPFLPIDLHKTDHLTEQYRHIFTMARRSLSKSPGSKASKASKASLAAARKEEELKPPTPDDSEDEDDDNENDMDDKDVEMEVPPKPISSDDDDDDDDNGDESKFKSSSEAALAYRDSSSSNNDTVSSTAPSSSRLFAPYRSLGQVSSGRPFYLLPHQNSAESMLCVPVDNHFQLVSTDKLAPSMVGQGLGTKMHVVAGATLSRPLWDTVRNTLGAFKGKSTGAWQPVRVRTLSSTVL
jgi:hypothetical protein